MTSQLSTAPGEKASARDYDYMARALQLARRGLCTTHPNPRVGCVVVKGDAVIGEGWHEKSGEPHAEVHALREAGTAAAGATLYVTLEPCCHHGRTPPCSRAIVEAGISRVVVAMRDPNPQVDNGGIEELRAAGIRLDVGVAEQPARDLNRGFIRRMQTGKPWTTLKIAASLDGRIAMAGGESKWITSEVARQDVHRLRARSSAILTGSGTVLQDDPSLTARIDGVTRQPLRVVLDSNLSVPPNARLFAQPGEALVFTTVEDEEAHEGLSRENVSVMALRGRRGMVDLETVMKELGRREINELMVEAGAVLSGAMLRRGLVDEIVVYLAPDLLGSGARGMFDLPGLDRMADKLQFEFTAMRQMGRDLRLTLAKPE